MGELQETFKSNEVKVTLEGLRSSRKLQYLSVFTKEKLTSTTKTALLTEADKSFIKREKIMVAQQTLRPSEVLPDLLIGQDLLNQVIEHHNPVIKLPSGLVLTPTIFGDVQCGSLIVATPLISSKDYSKTDKNVCGAEALRANIREPTPTCPFAAKNDEDVFSSKNARYMFHALLNCVSDIKWKLNQMEDRLRRLDERMHTLDLRTKQVPQTEVFRPGAPHCPTVPTTRCCYMIGHQATDGQTWSTILQASTGRIAQKPINRPIPLEIHSSSHDQNDESPTYRARATTSRKPSSSSRKKADVPVRRQTPRAAKKQVLLNTSVSS
ncbi:unnamed protein product [Haemonchus placei]|uniref:Uncharacterized protein n=1 Tax=Haemonchus placei TaxID=6290 RepID=A0A0N4X192_HAEPC|nr:unnamed protein product [Haemonchus placei]